MMDHLTTYHDATNFLVCEATFDYFDYIPIMTINTTSRKGPDIFSISKSF